MVVGLPGFWQLWRYHPSIVFLPSKSSLPFPIHWGSVRDGPLRSESTEANEHVQNLLLNGWHKLLLHLNIKGKFWIPLGRYPSSCSPNITQILPYTTIIYSKIYVVYVGKLLLHLSSSNPKGGFDRWQRCTTWRNTPKIKPTTTTTQWIVGWQPKSLGPIHIKIPRCRHRFCQNNKKNQNKNNNDNDNKQTTKKTNKQTNKQTKQPTNCILTCCLTCTPAT